MTNTGTLVSKTWFMRIGKYTVGIERSRGSFLAFYGLMPVYDPSGTSSQSERFDSLEDAAKFIGWPVGLVPLPDDMLKLASM